MLQCVAVFLQCHCSAITGGIDLAPSRPPVCCNISCSVLQCCYSVVAVCCSVVAVLLQCYYGGH